MGGRWVYFFGGQQADGDPQRKDILGGKGASLAAMTQAGLPVPPGFTISAECCPLFLQAGGRWPAGLAEEVRQNLARLEQLTGRKFGDSRVPLLVSVRSGAAVTMPGMMDTILNCGLAPAMAETVDDPAAFRRVYDQAEPFRRLHAARTGKPFPDNPWDALLAYIEAVFHSWNSQRAAAYRREHGIRGLHGTAVTVQAMFPAAVSGVVFTRNANRLEAEEMIIEASYGLGEAVVSGDVTPDHFVIDRGTLAKTRSVLGHKAQVVAALAGAELRDPDAPSLDDAQLRELASLALRVEKLFGCPVDVEWGLAAGRFALLQARPIRRGQGQAELQRQLIERAQARLRARIAVGGGPWVLHNLGETLPHPTPLTWSVQRRFMSGSGGFGALYRAVGFAPADAVCSEGFLELILGRIYMDTALAPEMFFTGYPFRYDINLLRFNPDAAQEPPSVPAGSFRRRMRVGRRALAVKGRLCELARNLDHDLRGQIIPQFVAWCRQERGRDLAALSARELVRLWHDRQRRVLDQFAPQSLLPSMVGGMALGELRAFLAEYFWDSEEDPGELAAGLSVPETADMTLQANAELRAVASGSRELTDWLEEYGHRGPEEMDLASPRWRERPAEILAVAERLGAGADPRELHRARSAKMGRQLDDLRKRLSPGAREELDQRVAVACRYIGFREDAKHYLMLGYDLLRDLALEFGRRLGLDDDVFFLSAEEVLRAVEAGTVDDPLVAERKAAYRAELRIRVPPVIDAEAIEALGKPADLHAAERYRASALSAGTATGPVQIVASPEEAGQLGQGYVLVCRSTDPAWMPLFVNAAGLILECGGTLSHGAIVAREMGIPAVVLPGATTLFHNGEPVTVDGHSQTVSRGSAASQAADATEAAADDVRIRWNMVPPPRGARERSGGKARNACLLVWGGLLAAACFLPAQWLYQPSLAALDHLLWPLVYWFGKPGMVAVAAAGLAALTMIGQRLLTDNRRLREAKRRANLLLREARNVPDPSPRRLALTQLAATVNPRLLAAAMLPLSILLGPMIMMFLWFPARVDPASWNAEAGAAVSVVATVDSSFRDAVAISVGEPLELDEASPASRTLPAIQETLQSLLENPAELPQDSAWTRQELLADLRDYLRAGVPPQSIMWKVRAPQDAEGRFTVSVTAGQGPPLALDVVLGDRFPPAPAALSADGPVKAVKVVYPPPQQKRVFWAPLAPLGNPQWDAGWLILYLLVYLPIMFLFRWLLRIA